VKINASERLLIDYRDQEKGFQSLVKKYAWSIITSGWPGCHSSGTGLASRELWEGRLRGLLLRLGLGLLQGLNCLGQLFYLTVLLLGFLSSELSPPLS